MSLKDDLNPPLINFGMPFVEQLQGFAGAAGAFFSQLTQQANSFLQGLYNRPNYVDMAWYMPGTLVAATAFTFRYPAIPVDKLSPLSVVKIQVRTAPVGSNATLSLWRSATSTVPGGKIADLLIFAGSTDGIAFTYYESERFTVPDSDLFVVCNTPGSGTPGADLFLVVRW